MKSGRNNKINSKILKKKSILLIFLTKSKIFLLSYFPFEF
jgi:hypothetical protein